MQAMGSWHMTLNLKFDFDRFMFDFRKTFSSPSLAMHKVNGQVFGRPKCEILSARLTVTEHWEVL